MAVAGDGVYDHDETLGVIAAVPPAFDATRLYSLLRTEYGIAGQLEPLISERDQNFRLVTPDNSSYVLKIASAAEPPANTRLQIDVLLHLEKQRCRIAVPRIRRTLSGEAATELASDKGSHTVRLVTWVPGLPLAGIPVGAELANDLGRSIARLGKALSSFDHPVEDHALLWDLKHARQIGPLLHHVDERGLHRRLTRVLDDFESHVLPRMPRLRSQIIHNDGNPANVMVASSAGSTARISGIIDFGDMVYAPLVNDVAIAAAYLRAPKQNPLEFILPMIAGFDAETPLCELERELLFDLIRTRLATTLVILWWRLSARSAEDAYRLAAIEQEADAERFLEALDELGRAAFSAALAGYLAPLCAGK